MFFLGRVTMSSIGKRKFIVNANENSKKMPRRKKQPINDMKFKTLLPDSSYGYPINVTGVPQAKCQNCFTLNFICESQSEKHFHESYITCECNGKQQFLGCYVPQSHVLKKKSNGAYEDTTTKNAPNENCLPNDPNYNHRMGFGKFRGKLIREIILTDAGRSWLEWASKNIKDSRNEAEMIFVKNALTHSKQSGSGSVGVFGNSNYMKPFKEIEDSKKYVNLKPIGQTDNESFHRLSTIPIIQAPLSYDDFHDEESSNEEHVPPIANQDNYENEFY